MHCHPQLGVPGDTMAGLRLAARQITGSGHVTGLRRADDSKSFLLYDNDSVERLQCQYQQVGMAGLRLNAGHWGVAPADSSLSRLVARLRVGRSSRVMCSFCVIAVRKGMELCIECRVVCGVGLKD